MTTQVRPRPQEWEREKKILPFLLARDTQKLEKQEINKLELFEQGLSNEIKKDDTIDTAFRKIVKMALAAEFGPSLVAAQGAKAMIDTIVAGIMQDPELRRQALYIVNRFAQ